MKNAGLIMPFSRSSLTAAKWKADTMCIVEELDAKARRIFKELITCKRAEEVSSADLQTRGCHCSCNSIGGVATIPSISTEIQPQLWPVCQVLKGESIPSPGWVTGTPRGI